MGFKIRIFSTQSTQDTKRRVERLASLLLDNVNRNRLRKEEKELDKACSK